MERERENRRPHVNTRVSPEKSSGWSEIKGDSGIEKLAPVLVDCYIFIIRGSRVIEVNLDLYNRSESPLKHLIRGREDSGEAAPDQHAHRKKGRAPRGDGEAAEAVSLRAIKRVVVRCAKKCRCRICKFTKWPPSSSGPRCDCQSRSRP
jgi:hypothetical protein